MAMTDDEVRDLHTRAEEAYAAGDYHLAGELFSSLLIEPNAIAGSGELHWNYAMCLAFEGNWPLAIQHVEVGGYSVDDFRETCRQANLRDAEHDFAQASQLYQNQQWDAAADAFTELLIHPGLEADSMRQMHWNIAMCMAHNGQFATALEHVRAGGYSELDFQQACHQSNIDIARHQYDVDGMLAHLRGERTEHLGQRIHGRVAMEGAPDVPVGGVQDSHTHTVRRATDIRSEACRDGGHPASSRRRAA